MNTPPDESFFTITLSQQGASDLLRTYRITRWIFAIVTVFCTLFMITAVMRYVNYRQYAFNGSVLTFLELRVFPLYWFFSSFLAAMQTYYYFRFTASCKKGIDTGQSELFNNSMKWLVKNASVASLLCTLDLFSALFYLYVELDIILNALPPA